MKTLRFFALSLVTAGLFTGNLFAADNGKPTNPGETKSVPAATKPTNGADNVGAKPDRLEGMIKDMGVVFEKKIDEKVNVTYFAVKEYGPDNFFFDIEESKSKTYTWVVFPCGKVPDSGIPAEIMEKLLTENTKMGTAFFQYLPASKMIYLKMPLSNAVLNAKTLKQEINWMLKDAARTRPLWDSTQWGSATAGK